MKGFMALYSSRKNRDENGKIKADEYFEQLSQFMSEEEAIAIPAWFDIYFAGIDGGIDITSLNMNKDGIIKMLEEYLAARKGELAGIGAYLDMANEDIIAKVIKINEDFAGKRRKITSQGTGSIDSEAAKKQDKSIGIRVVRQIVAVIQGLWRNTTKGPFGGTVANVVPNAKYDPIGPYFFNNRTNKMLKFTSALKDMLTGRIFKQDDSIFKPDNINSFRKMLFAT